MERHKDIVIQRLNGNITYRAAYSFNSCTNLRLENLRIREIATKAFQGFNELKKLNLETNEIHTIQDDAFKNLKQLEYLGLHQNCIKKIDENLLAYLENLKTLYFSLNSIEIIEPRSFDKLTNLECLHLNNNYLTSLPENIFNELRKLQKLKLSGNYITKLSGELFSKLEGLEILYLPYNKIEKIDEGCFKNLKKLKILNLNNNQIQVLDGSMLQSLPELEEFWANYNKIEEIDANLFCGTPKLKTLTLRGNLLTQIDDKLFDNKAKKLEKLNLDHNLITSLESDAIFKDLKELKTIDLSFNQIQYVNPKLFNGLDKLRVVNFYYNKINFISLQQNVCSIEELNLDNCNLNRFDMCQLNSLTNLVLYSNRIIRLSKDMFKNLKSLNNLFLFGNEIEDIEENAFEDLISLKELNLSSNLIASLKEGLFGKLTKLQKLYIFNNNLTELNSNAFNGLTSLEYLYLFGNKIRNIDNDTFRGLSNLKILLLNNNLIENTEWLSCESLKGLKILDLSSNHINKLPRNNLKNLCELNLFDNKIKELTAEFFQNFNSLNILQVENNRIENIYFLNYILDLCRNMCQLYVKNNQIKNLSEGERNLLEEISNKSNFQKITIDFSCTNNKIIANDDQISRINNFNILSCKKHFFEGQTVPAYIFKANLLLEYFQFFPSGHSICFSDIRRKLRMLTIITGDAISTEDKTNFLNLIQSQHQKENFIILKYANSSELDRQNKIFISPEVNPVFKIISEENLKEYRKFVSAAVDFEETKINIKNNVDLEVGHTAQFKHVFDKNKQELSLEFTRSIKEIEIKHLKEKIRRNNISSANLNEFLKRQILKKVYFNDLRVLINLDIKYDEELKSINEYLIKNNFKYSIIKPLMQESSETSNEIKLYEIYLMNLDSNYKVKLNSLNQLDSLRLYLLLIERDRDVIKVNMENFYQILLIDKIDYLCENRRIIVDKVMTSIKNNLINYMNIQVVTTISNNEVLEFNNDCVLELHEIENSRNRVSLRKYETILVQSIKQQEAYLKEKKRAITDSVNSNNKDDMLHLKCENSILKREKEDDRKSIKFMEDQIFTLTEENKKLRHEIVQIAREKKITSITIQQAEPKNAINSSPTAVKNFLLELNSKQITELTKDDAKSFIQLLSNERDCIGGIARDIICGSIKNLVYDLYSSSSHYFYEILQNFEDTLYKDRAVVKIFIDSSCVIFANNEIGFTPNDINSICSLSVSQKLLDTHIGNKGIGFKSAFLCTNNPIIVSKPIWYFQFVLNNNDMLSCITPLHVDHVPDVLENYFMNNSNLTTFMYLPFKDAYNLESIKNILDTVDIHVLLFTNKIDELIIEDKRNNQLIKLSRTFEVENVSFGDNIQIINATLLKNGVTYEKFRVFKADKIAYAFPISTNKTKQFPIYSTFPIYNDLNLKFIINSYWHLTTNRESVNEYDCENLLLRQKLLDIFAYVIKNDEIISTNLLTYLPDLNVNASLWWKSFLNELVVIIKSFIEKKYSKFRIFNEDINKLADRKAFKLIDLELIDKSESENLNIYGIKNSSVEDLLIMLQSNDSKLAEWYEMKNDEWFENLFRVLVIHDKCHLLLKEIFSAKMFLIDSKRQTIDKFDEDKIFIKGTQNSSIKSICNHHKIVLLDFKSTSEKTFLEKHLNFTEINEEFIFKTILDSHKDLNENFNKERLLNDLDYIKNNFDKFMEYIRLKKNDFILCVPIKGKLFALIEHSTISTLFQVDLTSQPGIPFVKNKENYNFIEYPTVNLKECLEHELFYLNLKCKLPEVNIQLLNEKISLQEKVLPLIDVLNNEKLGNEEIRLANKILELLPNEFIETVIHSLPVKTISGEIIQISKSNVNPTVSDSIRICVSNKTYQLAKNFGVNENCVHKNSTEFNSIAIELEKEPNKIDSKITTVKEKTEKPFVKIDKNFEFLFPNYSERVKLESQERLEKRNFLNETENEASVERIYNFEETFNTGIKAEYYFYLFLQHKFKNSLKIEECWISSLRSRVFINNYTNCDDTKGYDFKIFDEKNIFSSSKTCFIEVKGFSSEWNNSFILTKHEMNQANSLGNNESYLIAIIENIHDSHNIRIATIINWTQDKDRLKQLEYESYRFKFNPK